MASRSGRYSIFVNAVNSVSKAKEKREETLVHTKRLAEMQKMIDLSEEKQQLLIETITPLKDKGVIVYVELLEVVDSLEKLLKKHGFEVLTITGKTSQTNRAKVSDEFMEDPRGKVVLFSSAGSESVDLNATQDIALYNTPKGSKSFNQVIGRVARGFGEFTQFNIHEIVVEDTLDEYKQILLSSKREIEQTILNSDTIPLKNDIGSFDAQVLKKIRNKMLWKLGKRKKPD